VHESGVPFQDASGKRLRAWLGVSEQTFYDPRQIAILPMGFCYPGTGRSGDLPPRPECAPAWRRSLLDCLPELELTIVLGMHALATHWPGAGEGRRPTLTDCVRDWRTHWPRLVVLPHPSPRNQRWLRTHPWFEEQVLPALRERLAELGLAVGSASTRAR
jgi:uracil-DNA glycosylase